MDRLYRTCLERALKFQGKGANRQIEIEVSNHGQVESEASEVRIEAYGEKSGTVEWTIPCSPIRPYEKNVIESKVPGRLKAGGGYTFEITTGERLQQPLSVRRAENQSAINRKFASDMPPHEAPADRIL